MNKIFGSHHGFVSYRASKVKGLNILVRIHAFKRYVLVLIVAGASEAIEYK